MALFFLAIAAGVLTVLAPCILPVLPIILGSAGRSRSRPLFVVAGFVGSFALVGAALATAGAFLGLGGETLRFLAIVFLSVFGAALLWPSAYERAISRIQPLFTRAGAVFSGRPSQGGDALSGLAVGVALGLVWTPCAGPILGTILTLAARTKDFLSVMLLMAAYALGAGAPMLAIAYGGQAAAKKLRGFGAWQPVLARTLGLLIILMAAAMITGYDVALVAWLSTWYPVREILKL